MVGTEGRVTVSLISRVLEGLRDTSCCDSGKTPTPLIPAFSSFCKTKVVDQPRMTLPASSPFS